MSHVTHEQFIAAVRDAAVHYASTVHRMTVGKLYGVTAFAIAPTLNADQLSAVARAKLLYGRGHAGLRGVTQYGGWKNGDTDELIEICAAGEENWVQLAGTTIHECAHVAMGMGHGHNKGWKDACAALGLRRVHAAGTIYHLANFAPELREVIYRLPHPTDGLPNLGAGLGQLFTFATRPCKAGVGTRGGKSQGPGSGRLRKYVCPHGQIVRASTDVLSAHCDVCSGVFSLAV